MQKNTLHENTAHSQAFSKTTYDNLQTIKCQRDYTELFK